MWTCRRDTCDPSESSLALVVGVGNVVPSRGHICYACFSLCGQEHAEKSLFAPVLPPLSREAAKECRRRKKEYVKCLESRVAVLEVQNKKLIEELETLKDICSSKAD